MHTCAFSNLIKCTKRCTLKHNFKCIRYCNVKVQSKVSSNETSIKSPSALTTSNSDLPSNTSKKGHLRNFQKSYRLRNVLQLQENQHYAKYLQISLVQSSIDVKNWSWSCPQYERIAPIKAVLLAINVTAWNLNLRLE